MADAPVSNATVASSDEKNLVVSFIQFVRHKVSANECNPDQIEALEVAVQCMESAFGLTDANYAFQPSKPLLDIFVAAEGLPSGETALPEPNEAEIAQANKLKEEGNDLMKASQFDAAINKYNEAIKLNRDPVYFCNRAAAFCRLEQYDLAIQDCRTALALDPNYSKAYGRMGLALSCQNRYQQAVEAYKRALELEPNQDSYKNNLKIAEDKVREMEAATAGQPQDPLAAMASMFGGGGAGGAGLPGGMDFASMLSNPQMMNMAQTLMNDPNIQNMMGQMMQGGAGMGNIFQAGQQLAQQMQSSNPEFVEQLRQQFEGHGPNQDNQNPPQNPPPAPHAATLIFVLQTIENKSILGSSIDQSECLPSEDGNDRWRHSNTKFSKIHANVETGMDSTSGFNTKRPHKISINSGCPPSADEEVKVETEEPESTKQYDIPCVPMKRGRGRPRIVLPEPTKENDIPCVPVKRGRGRPRIHFPGVTVEKRRKRKRKADKWTRPKIHRQSRSEGPFPQEKVLRGKRGPYRKNKVPLPPDVHQRIMDLLKAAAMEMERLDKEVAVFLSQRHRRVPSRTDEQSGPPDYHSSFLPIQSRLTLTERDELLRGRLKKMAENSESLSRQRRQMVQANSGGQCFLIRGILAKYHSTRKTHTGSKRIRHIVIQDVPYSGIDELAILSNGSVTYPYIMKLAFPERNANTDVSTNVTNTERLLASTQSPSIEMSLNLPSTVKMEVEEENFNTHQARSSDVIETSAPKDPRIKSEIEDPEYQNGAPLSDSIDTAQATVPPLVPLIVSSAVVAPAPVPMLAPAPSQSAYPAATTPHTSNIIVADPHYCPAIGPRRVTVRLAQALAPPPSSSTRLVPGNMQVQQQQQPCSSSSPPPSSIDILLPPPPPRPVPRTIVREANGMQYVLISKAKVVRLKYLEGRISFLKEERSRVRTKYYTIVMQLNAIENCGMPQRGYGIPIDLQSRQRQKIREHAALSQRSRTLMARIDEITMEIEQLMQDSVSCM